MSSLQGRTVLVTGAARRLGREIAIHLARLGCDVIVAYRSSKTEAESVSTEINSMGRRSWLLQSAFDREESCSGLVERAFSSAGKVDFLVNNASLFPKGAIESSGRKELEETMLVNSWSPLWLSNAFASRARKGAIVNMLDARITGYDFSNFPYYLSKKILLDITENLALRYAPSIRVNGVAPGLIIPPEGKDESYLERVSRVVPMRTHGSAGDIAEAVEFLLKSDFITGQTIFIDGGQHLLHHIFGNTAAGASGSTASSIR